jgi:hypothetical protein
MQTQSPFFGNTSQKILISILNHFFDSVITKAYATLRLCEG